MPKSFPKTEVEQATGVSPLRWKQVESGGYGRVNAHWRVELGDGRSVFVKHALTDDAAGWLRTERLVLESVQAAFTAAYHGAFDDGSCTLIVIEDLCAASWSPRWSSERIDAVLAALAALHATRPPEGLPTLEGKLERVIGWPAVAAVALDGALQSIVAGGGVAVLARSRDERRPPRNRASPLRRAQRQPLL